MTADSGRGNAAPTDLSDCIRSFAATIQTYGFGQVQATSYQDSSPCEGQQMGLVHERVYSKSHKAFVVGLKHEQCLCGDHQVPLLEVEVWFAAKRRTANFATAIAASWMMNPGNMNHWVITTRGANCIFLQSTYGISSWCSALEELIMLLTDLYFELQNFLSKEDFFAEGISTASSTLRLLQEPRCEIDVPFDAWDTDAVLPPLLQRQLIVDFRR